MESVKETVKIRVCKGGAWERVDGALEYMPLNCVKRTLILPLLSSYSCLLEAVSERLEIDANSDFMVTYNLDNDIVETNSGSNQQSNFIHATPSVNVYQTEYHATQIHQTQIPSSGGFYQNLPIYQQMHGFSGNPMYVPGFLGYPMQDPQSDSANERDLLDDEKLRPFGEKIMGSVFGKVKRLSGEDESSEYDEEVSESDEDAETTPVANKNFKEDKFWNMPPLLKTPVLDIKKKGMCYGTSSLVRLHDTFDSKEQIKIVLGRKALEEGFQIRYPRSDPERVYAKCIVNTCEWIFRAYIPKDYKKFYVTAFVDHHTCTKTQIHPHHHNASPKVLGHILKEVMSESSMIYRGKEIMTDMKARFKIDISYSQAWRSKCYALQLLRGTPEESFAELPLYCHNLKLKNQRTITHIETDDEDRFEIFFLVVSAVIRTFVLHMRPLIIIDGAHLKGEFLGTMYLAVAMDGNNQILPLAYGVGKSETFRSWDWFLTKFKECIIGKQDHLTIISDGAVSIASAIKNVFPNAFHGRCCRHLLMNLREKCPRFISKEELFWKACKAYRISDFEERFSTLRDWLPSIANKLDMIGLEKWARVHFPGMRYNYMTSNSAESVNALSRHSRKLPICMMIDWFIKSLQQWYFEHRQTADEHKHELTPWAEAKLAQRIAKSATWTVRPAANYLYNVVDYYKNATVDLNTRTLHNQFAFHVSKTSVWGLHSSCVIYDGWAHPSGMGQTDGLISVLSPVMDKTFSTRKAGDLICKDKRKQKRSKTDKKQKRQDKSEE
ncbi:transmembrane 9 superfamily member 11-like protein [Tanacetum coccineum]|uniref:Transmembrane 9 superfamily member 11-like protein n=1 Tax=Tanacetum coccineum TaxID=301880 RepID=A0ABQ5BWY8_9ASTR